MTGGTKLLVDLSRFDVLHIRRRMRSDLEGLVT